MNALYRLYVLGVAGCLAGTTVLFGQQQKQQLQNPGFENWEEIRSGVYEPVGWNSIKNTDGGSAQNRLAPNVISQSETPRSGKYALQCTNKSTLGIVANGMVTTGAIHGNKNKDKSYVYTDAGVPGFSLPFVSRPDSVAGWYKYTPLGNDSAMVVLLLHKGKATLPDHGTRNNWVGGVKLILPATRKNTWTRFSAPFTYLKEVSPQYLLIVLSAGNRKQAVEGSVAVFDDLELIYNK